MQTMPVTCRQEDQLQELSTSWGVEAISWGSRLQPTMAAFTSEAEYMAAAQAVQEALWLRTLLCSFGI